MCVFLSMSEQCHACKPYKPYICGYLSIYSYLMLSALYICRYLCHALHHPPSITVTTTTTITLTSALLLSPACIMYPIFYMKLNSRLVSTLTQYLKICNAFNMLHTHTPAAYVHQDVKPENILISAPSCTSYTDSTGRARAQYSSFSSSSPSPSSSYVDNMNNSSDSSAHGMMMMADDDVEGGTFSGNSNGNSSSSSGGSGTDKWYGGHGEPLLTDFGSVRLADVSITSRTDSLRVADEAAQFCTVSYRAPELFDPPKGSTLDTRTDVWGLGCLLFCMWFGYSPYECTFMQGVIKVADCR